MHSVELACCCFFRNGVCISAEVGPGLLRRTSFLNPNSSLNCCFDFHKWAWRLFFICSHTFNIPGHKPPNTGTSLMSANLQSSDLPRDFFLLYFMSKNFILSCNSKFQVIKKGNGKRHADMNCCMLAMPVRMPWER